MCEDNKEKTLRLIHSALRRTIRIGKNIEIQHALSADEIRLLLFRYEISEEQDFHELKAILSYLEQKKMNESEKGKVYPYAVLLLADRGKSYMEPWQILCYLKEALDLLRKTGQLLYLPEIIEQYVELAEELNGEKEELKILERQQRTLLGLERKFHMDFSRYRLFQYTDREFEADYEVIRKTRIVSGLSQEKLCEGICTQETLSRIENRKRRPDHRTLAYLLKKMNREHERIRLPIKAENAEILRLQRTFKRKTYELDWEGGEKILQTLKEKADLSETENRQYIAMADVEIRQKKGELTAEESIEKLYEILSMTLP